MLRALLLILFVGLCLSAPSHKDERLWETYKVQHGKSYSSDVEEYHHKAIWESNLLKIAAHNAEADLGIHSYRWGVNQFTDLDTHDMMHTLGGFVKSAHPMNQTVTFLEPSNMDLPKEVDWRKEGYVTEVKNQGKCSSCWAFAATGTLEGQHFKKTGNLVSLSEQQIMDCTDVGCKRGSSPAGAIGYISAQGGIESEEKYPYDAKDQECRFNKKDAVATVLGYQLLPQNELILQEIIATIGPVAIGIDSSVGFHHYKSGIYSEDLKDVPILYHHALLIVGYGEENGTPFWIVKNSWGPKWGENGYIRMIRNQNQSRLTQFSCYPLV